MYKTHINSNTSAGKEEIVPVNGTQDGVTNRTTRRIVIAASKNVEKYLSANNNYTMVFLPLILFDKLQQIDLNSILKQKIFPH